MKKFLSLIIFFLSLLVMTGCWDSKELNDQAIAFGFSMDVAENGTYQVSGQFIIPSKMATGEKGGGGGSAFFVETAKGKDLYEARQNLQNKLSRTIFKNQRLSIYIGERLARRGIKEIVDMITRDPEAGIRTDISVVKGGQGLDVLKTFYPLESNSSQASLKIHEQFDTAANTTFLNLVVTSTNASSSSLPAWTLDSSSRNESQQKNLKFAGSAIFNENLKLVGYLNNEEAKNQMWITEKLSYQYITLFIPQENGNISVELRNLKRNIRTTFQGNKVKVHLTLTGNGEVKQNNTTFDLTQSNKVNTVEKEVEEQFEKSVRHLIKKAQKKYKTDIFGFGDTIFRRHPTQWKKIKNDWKKEFTEADVTVDVNIAIRLIGLTGSSASIEEEK
ncbi:Ger(x)C family spore germination protein [Bacillus sp. ISL-46]|uniref:Ger(x)C family spore germination protein n=1 Tax=Bacillus sp. ISL-46 TaxID=2819129 RepID=UPI001BE5C99B|nr:Ger(x)C family spore germination protein [Bacillus sp. ISL-46]MBT2723311.1 Ger(x)C family spore germination protein [Bacillus sp. ISL-46]